MKKQLKDIKKDFVKNFKKHREDGLSIEDIAIKYGIGATTARRWRDKLKLSRDSLIDLQYKKQGPQELPTKAKPLKRKQIINLLKTGTLDVIEYSQMNNVERHQLYDYFEQLEKQGYVIAKSHSGFYIHTQMKATDKKIEILKSKIKIGLCSDNHYGSKHQQKEYLHKFYDECEAAGITQVYNCGDICTGSPNMHKGFINNMFIHTATDQANYIVDHYPKRKGIKTHFIMGNHDASWMKDNGFNICEYVASKRPDMIYEGDFGVYLHIGKENPIKVYLMHPDAGPSYAVSYKPQKIIEGFTSERKPHVLFIGHWHQFENLFKRNVDCYQAGCFEGQTDYLKRKGIYPELGAWQIEFEISAKGIHSTRAQKFCYYVEKANDY